MRQNKQKLLENAWRLNKLSKAIIQNRTRNGNQFRPTLINSIDRFHSRDQRPYWFNETKESIYIKIEFNSQRVSLVHQYGRRDVMWKRSIANRAFSSSFVRVCIWADSKCTEIESGCDFIVYFFGKLLFTIKFLFLVGQSIPNQRSYSIPSCLWVWRQSSACGRYSNQQPDTKKLKTIVF